NCRSATQHQLGWHPSRPGSRDPRWWTAAHRAPARGDGMRSPSGKEKHRPRKKPRVTVEDTRASLSRTLIVAGVGLALGIAWPWIVGISLVPEPPISDGSARSEQEASGQAQAQV